MMLRNRTALVRFTLGLTLYLLLFSAFALYHTYANDELINSHGCQIGEWVQHGQTVIVALPLIAALLALVLVLHETPSGYIPRQFAFGLTARAPPSAVR